MDDYSTQRKYLVELLRRKGINNEAVLTAIMDVPREQFVPSISQSFAYDDNAMAIGCGQTISQPYVVALMTQLLVSKPLKKVLEIGTGSGYQAAVLSKLVPEVYSIERIEELKDRAQQCLDALNIQNVHLKHSDGHLGWPEQAPFDGIIMTAAAHEEPTVLLEQLSDEGVMVFPIDSGWGQDLVVYRKHQGQLSTQIITGVMFVPMRGGVE